MITNPGTHLVEGLQQIRDNLAAAAEHLTGQDLRTNQQHVANLDRFIADPQVQDVLSSSQAYADRGHILDQKLNELGLQPTSQTAQRAAMIRPSSTWVPRS